MADHQKTPTGKSVDSFRYIIGIDLGTTQCALSYLDLMDREAGIRPFPVPQLVSRAETSDSPTLPSLLFLPDLSAPVPPVPWQLSDSPIIGHYAHEVGCEVPSRLIHSAKSWLCHPRVDRKAPILPWQSETVKEKLSPVQASTWLLKHLTAVWNMRMAADDASASLQKQKVIITIPASFDPSARNLTLEAIQAAGIPEVALLEEPQSAFYDYLARNAVDLKKDLTGVKTVLVVDIGGGTSDFSLISVERPRGAPLPVFNRLAVGPHLLIGGDNIDLAIARHVEIRLKHRGKKLLLKQWLRLLRDSRAAKERFLGVTIHQKVSFTISGAGSSVLAQTVREEIDALELQQMVMEGFFPAVPSDAKPAEEGALGLSEAGLPYTRDPAITRHLAAFLAENQMCPDAVLFNGGTTMASCLRERLIDSIASWNKGVAPRVLGNPHPTLAVSLGAVYFGMTGFGLGETIKSGCPVSIYVGIGNDAASTPGNYLPEKLLCLLPKGSDTETEVQVPGKTFGVDRSRDVAFYLYYSNTAASGEEPGFEAAKLTRRFKPLPPVTLRAEESADQDIAQVSLGITLRETGYLRLLCHALDGGLVQELSFDVNPDKPPKSAVSGKKDAAVLNKRRLTHVKKILESPFEASMAESAFNQVFKSLEEVIEQPRKDWDISLLRSLFDLVITDRRYLETIEAQVCYFRLCGYCLRPGFGHPNDADRLSSLWKLHGKTFSAVDQNFWSDWWLLWKRVVAGLDTDRQRMLAETIEPLLFPPKKPVPGMRKPSQHERNNIWRLLGNLELLPVETKERLGWWIVRHPPSFSQDAVALFALGRLGARQLSYADHTLLVSRTVVNGWIEVLLKYGQSSNSYLDWALKELCRKTGDRLVQADDVLRKRALETLKQHNRKKDFIAPLVEIVALRREDFAEIIGEQLPSGFVWVKEHEPSPRETNQGE